MSFLQVIIMGVIHGLTEFLPISSSGHLALFKILFGIEAETGILYEILLHVGTLAAICLVYYKDIFKLCAEGCRILRDAFVNVLIFFRNQIKRESEEYRKVISNGYRKFVMLVLVSSIPTGVIGFFGRNAVALASQILLVPGICLIVTAVLLFIADHSREGGKLPKSATYTDAFIIGISQGVATLPGLSRAGTTITAALLCGYQRNFAVKYSFIMSIPAILGSLVLKLTMLGKIAATPTELASYIIGMLVAAVIGYICIKTMLVIVRRKKFTIFAVYCLFIGMLSIGGYFYMA